MSNQPKTLLGQYHYSALDTLSTCTLGEQPSSQRFYLKQRLITEIQGALRHSVMQHEGQLLAQQQYQAGTLHTHLLATDQQRSVLALLDATRGHQLAYSPYGHRAPENALLSLLGFNGEQPDPLTGCYLLGNGYRAFSPVLMRFHCPDSWSPFGRGGLNAYGYCVGDPVNRQDPNGHSNFLMSAFKGAMNRLGLRQPTPPTAQPFNHAPSPQNGAATLTPVADRLPPPSYWEATQRDVAGSSVANSRHTSQRQLNVIIRVKVPANYAFRDLPRAPGGPHSRDTIVTNGIFMPRPIVARSGTVNPYFNVPPNPEPGSRAGLRSYSQVIAEDRYATQFQNAGRIRSVDSPRNNDPDAFLY